MQGAVSSDTTGKPEFFLFSVVVFAASLRLMQRPRKSGTKRKEGLPSRQTSQVKNRRFGFYKKAELRGFKSKQSRTRRRLKQ